MLRIDNLIKDYTSGFLRKKVRVLEDVSFSVNKGEIFGFGGPNGAGKTTLLNADGKQAGTVQLADGLFGAPVNEALIHQAVVTQLASRRLAPSDTLTRGEVTGGGRKPWRQKGTGRARSGSTRIRSRAATPRSRSATSTPSTSTPTTARRSSARSSRWLTVSRGGSAPRDCGRAR